MTTAESPGAELAADRRAIDAELTALSARDLAPLTGPVADAVRYALLGGGKRLRGALLLAAYRAAGGHGDAGLMAAAVEVVHAYSLVHDDLPCMDNDDMRRGRSTVHVQFGVPVATAAGLAMVPFAARVMTEAATALGLPDQVTTAVLRTLLQASGAGGMIGGQLLDLEGEAAPLTLDALERVHRMKTGALISAAVVIGGLAGGATPAVQAALRTYGDAVGLAFQIADDVLDVTSTTDQLGKTAGRDAALRKSTYPALLGLVPARERATHLSADAVAALRESGIHSTALEALAHFVVTRRS